MGGPLGYLYNLDDGLSRINNNGIYFLKEEAIKESNKNTIKYKIKKIIPKTIWSKLTLLKYIKSIIGSNGKEYIHSFEDYDAVHFHSTADLYKNRELLKNYKGKVILTSHSPEATYLEICDLMKAARFPKIFIKKVAIKLKEVDIFAFKKATDLIFPCKYAMEPYLDTFDYFKENYYALLDKTHFLTTGVKNSHSKPEDKLMHKNKFKVCYIGRHNSIKGYDLLVKAAELINKKDIDIEFVIAGKLGPIYPNKHLKNWKELGWINNPLDIEASCDLFVLPNRETYFDLALVEALSVPTVVLISETGGNKFFKKFHTNAINFFNPNSVEDLANQIINIKQNYDIANLKKKSKKIYQENFTTDLFAKHYIRVIKQIVGVH